MAKTTAAGLQWVLSFFTRSSKDGGGVARASEDDGGGRAPRGRFWQTAMVVVILSAMVDFDNEGDNADHEEDHGHGSKKTSEMEAMAPAMEATTKWEAFGMIDHSVHGGRVPM